MRTRNRLSAAIVGAVVASSLLWSGGSPGSTAHAAPGLPEDPTVILDETFEATSNGEQPQMISSYDGGSYTGSTFWTSAGSCNGIVLSYNSPQQAYTDPGGTGTCSADSISYLREIARAIGGGSGAPAAAVNTVVSSYTFGNTASNEIQIESPSEPVVDGRWYTASLRFGAINCQFRGPLYNFYLVDDATGQETLIGGPVNACTDPGAADVPTPRGPVRVGLIQSPGSLQWAGSDALSLRVRNAEGSGFGNDSAIDDLRLVEATPSIDKQFVLPGSPDTGLDLTGVGVGQPVTARFIVTNSSELAGKRGIAFTDALSAGLQVAENPNVVNSCGGTVTASPGAASIALAAGVLDSDEVTCTVEVDVVATGNGTFSNGASNLTTPLLTPTEATTVRVSNPEANDDAAGSRPGGQPFTLNIIGNDQPLGDPSSPLDPSTLRFPSDGQPAGATVSADGLTLVVPGEGTYEIDPGTGEATFTPDPALRTATTLTPVVYQVTDANGASDTARITGSIEALPSADDERVRTSSGIPVDIDVLEGDSTDPSSPLQPASVLFPTSGQPAGATISDGGKTLTVPGEGTYSIDPVTGVVTFEPAPAFAGDTTPVTYQVYDANGAGTTATVGVDVLDAIDAVDDTTTTTQAGVPVTIPAVDNDTADAASPIDPTTMFFPAGGQPTGSVIGAGGRTLTVPGEGEYVIDPDTGAVTFSPEPTFTGPATPVTYSVEDADGLADTATITVTVGALPVVTDDSATTTQGVPVGVPVLANDGSPGATALDPSTVTFPTAGQPLGATVSGDGRSLTVPGVGLFVADTTTGVVTFTPEPDFVGSTFAVSYSVADVNGATTSAEVVVSVTATPAANADTVRAPFGRPTAPVDLLSNDVAADGATLVPTSVVFPADGQPAGSAVSADGRTLTVPGQGTYEIDPATGETVFTPESGFSGRATPVAYRVTDTNGGVAESTLTVTIGAAPVARDDSAATAPGRAVTVPVLGNDETDGATVLDPSTVVFPESGQPGGAVVSADGTTIAVPGEGVYTVDPTSGAVDFTPEAGFDGIATPVVYEVSDGDGNVASARITIEVDAELRASVTPDAGTTREGEPVTIDVLRNDSPSAGAEWVPSSVVFPTDGQPDGAVLSDGGKTLTVPGEGVYRIAADGRVTFTPAAGFSGAATPVRYEVSDSAGAVVSSEIAIVVAAAEPAPGPGAPGEGTPGEGALPVTGPLSPAPIAATAMLLLLLGAVIVVVSSRARRTSGR